ncbi:hypothetical protein OIV83_005259 [Microbotryomycetes sp. JL201]|nr:hypothetical protein OIV83_005259 [Microbotryomycetes sp. JL201]
MNSSTDAARTLETRSNEAIAPDSVPDHAAKERPKHKKANLPFLVHQRYLAKQRQLKQQQQQSRLSDKAGQESATGRTVPGEMPSVVRSVLKWVVLAIVTSALVSKTVTGTFSWNYDGKFSSVTKIQQALLPPKQVYLSEHQLALHDGSNPKYPVYVALDGDVFDVSSGNGPSTYGPGGSYHHFAGKDAARAYVTGCFKTHLTHDLRGLTPKQLDSLAYWKKFYAEHKLYRKVGQVAHPPIDPDSPVPQDCNAKKEGGAM